MALKKPDVQYVRYDYVYGNAARKLEPEVLPQPQRRRHVRQKQQPQRVVRIDPLVAVGLLMSVVMLVLILVGAAQYSAMQQQTVALEKYIGTMAQKNIVLHHEYEAGLDLADVEEKALALGMIPIEQAQHIAITIEAPEEPVQPSLWERFLANWDDPFA
ncbi:MAG: hypothetical protein IJB17_03580 [Oscillospiraceae bacterium]|nr:hypothetical protein [Oscillospiraceae bacterium]